MIGSKIIMMSSERLANILILPTRLSSICLDQFWKQRLWLANKWNVILQKINQQAYAKPNVNETQGWYHNMQSYYEIIHRNFT